jgi:hypothetical protein
MIKWTEKHSHVQEYSVEAKGYINLKAKPTYEGLVVSGPHRTTYFLASDYGIGVYVIVWNPEKLTTEQVSVGYEDYGTDWYTEGGAEGITVDATPEVLEAVRIQEVEDRWCRDMIADLEDERTVTTGKAVEVYKGRKVPVGTTGIVRWMGDGKWGMRVGLKVEGQDKLVYTALSNVRVDQSAEGRALQAAAKAEYEAWRAAKDKAAVGLSKGMTVKVTDGRDAGMVGVIFWLRDGRLGVKADPRDRAEQPVWCNATQVVAA